MKFCAEFCRQTCPECLVAPFCAGIGYLFLRGMGKCSRLRGMGVPNLPGMLRGTVLRGNQPPNPPGMPRGTVLRGNGVSFSARGMLMRV